MSCHTARPPRRCPWVLPLNIYNKLYSHHAIVLHTIRLLAQANLTPAEAAKLWSTVKSEAADLGADIVSPAVNFCGGDCTQEV